MLVDRILKHLDVEVELFALCEVAEGADLVIGDLGWVTMHFVLAGNGEISVGSERKLPLPRYSLCLVKRPHLLHGTSSELPRPTLKLDGVTRLLGKPDGPPDFVVACGRIQATYGRGLDLFDLLEDPLVVDFSASEQMRSLFTAILSESAHPTEGSVGMVSAFMRQALVLLLRQLSDSSTDGLTWVDALADPRMSEVVRKVLDQPDGLHSVASMADTAQMSRSAFANHFKQCFNQTPMHFVRRVRLRMSAELLTTTQEKIGAIARESGFASRSHFTRTFKVEYGVAPGEFRQQARSGQ